MIWKELSVPRLYCLMAWLDREERKSRGLPQGFIYSFSQHLRSRDSITKTLRSIIWFKMPKRFRWPVIHARNAARKSGQTGRVVLLLVHVGVEHGP